MYWKILFLLTLSCQWAYSYETPDMESDLSDPDPICSTPLVDASGNTLFTACYLPKKNDVGKTTGVTLWLTPGEDFQDPPSQASTQHSPKWQVFIEFGDGTHTTRVVEGGRLGEPDLVGTNPTPNPGTRSRDSTTSSSAPTTVRKFRIEHDYLSDGDYEVRIRAVPI